ncbi:MAG: transcription termination factor NusA [Candidatus Wildermuthbacteria bacterium RIFCSPHIGHO2_02_FULL_49_9]|uniref:Transcription termination/antitermination protein NusA n=1 Tax=Candidatus Wildermuthbacteria bacterium RIFCSPHIGHO2_02_FULL_49_9 TaxID=1802456 RepID=A0A1G2RBJ4_9BACT|nr:MAG: transcription termination factor NusA [Candidatus Wildermuthbacteria bacterium RIFCSPHIGHO2_02_FULL_49_9]
MDIKNFLLAMENIAEEKGLEKDKVLELIEQAVAAAYKKEYGARGQVVKADMDPKTGKVEFWQVKQVVDESMIYSEEELERLKGNPPVGPEEDVAQEGKKVRFHPERHIMLQDAKKIKKGVKAGEDLEMKLVSKEEFGRIAAQTAKQVILQKLREAERESVLQEFQSRQGELVSGIVQRVEGRMVIVDLGKTSGVLPREEQVPGEFYRVGQRLKFYLLSVEDQPRGPSLILSRAYPKFISKLFELEVPEIGAGSVEIKSITREPGSRSKVAVVSNEEGVDPVGSMVGQRGTRVSAVINELGGEKIDIIEWDKDPEVFLANSLSPARVLQVEVQGQNKAMAIVSEDQLSLAIGRDGQNVRLAAKLTGWKIDIKTPEGKEVSVEQEKAEQAGEISEEQTS